MWLSIRTKKFTPHIATVLLPSKYISKGSNGAELCPPPAEDISALHL